MIGASGSNSNLNFELEKRHTLIHFFQNAEIEELAKLGYDWDTDGVKPNSAAFQVFENNGLIDSEEQQPKLTRVGKLILSRVLVQFP